MHSLLLKCLILFHIFYHSQSAEERFCMKFWVANANSIVLQSTLTTFKNICHQQNQILITQAYEISNLSSAWRLCRILEYLISSRISSICLLHGSCVNENRCWNRLTRGFIFCHWAGYKIDVHDPDSSALRLEFAKFTSRRPHQGFHGRR